MFFEEDDELQRSDRIEDAPGDERGALGELTGIFAGKEFLQDEMMDDLRRFFHDGLEPLLHKSVIGGQATL